jgi:hypothetical protein
VIDARLEIVPLAQRLGQGHHHVVGKLQLHAAVQADEVVMPSLPQELVLDLPAPQIGLAHQRLLFQPGERPVDRRQVGIGIAQADVRKDRLGGLVPHQIAHRVQHHQALRRQPLPPRPDRIELPALIRAATPTHHQSPEESLNNQETRNANTPQIA